MSKCNCCNNILADSIYLLLNEQCYKSCPKCSQRVGQHVFYHCPDKFGSTSARASENSPMGIQSQCSKCRSNKNGPHTDALICSKAIEKVGHIIPEIRILPMSSEMFPTDELLLEFLTETMPNRGYTYYYPSNKLNSPAGTLILFQYKAKLWGYAILSDIVEFGTPQKLEDGSLYKGYYQFKSNSLVIFENPITSDEFKSINPYFKGFSQAIQKMSAGLLPSIIGLLKHNKTYRILQKDSPVFPEEIDESATTEGAKKQIIVNAYERNPLARKKCLEHYKEKNNGKIVCEICGFDFGKTYGSEFENKIHVHHIVEISSIGKEYTIDGIKDLIPICPNCHMIAHSKKPAYTPDEIKKFLNNQ